ncbi:MAG TPA: hypothetical protein IAC86_03415 [Candidatus Cryptobacteroides excrementigallinarum]|nr:hypothetical protein [Candidatus Cryptobacteroides excrementigallinarum]
MEFTANSVPKHLFVTEKTPLLNDYPVGCRGGSKKSEAGLKVESGIWNPESGICNLQSAISNQQLAICYSQSGIQPVTGGFQQKFCALAGFQDKARAHECPVPHFLHRRIPKTSVLRQGRRIKPQNADAMQGQPQARRLNA